MSNLVDFSFSRPSTAAIKTAGASGVLRYVCSPTISPGKGITTAEAKELEAAGLPYGLVYEDGVDDWVGGANAGAVKATIAGPTLKAIGFGAGRPVYCAVDENLPALQYVDTWEGIHAFATALGRPDACYGPRPFLLWLQKNHGVEWLWELGSSSYNTGPEPTNKRIQQLVSCPSGCKVLGGVDWDVALTEDWGQFPAPVAPKPAPVPTPKPTPKPQPAPKPALTADQYAAAHGMVRIDHQEALEAVAAHLAWYTWSAGAMHGRSDTHIPTGVVLFAFKANLDAHHIAHAGA